MRERIKNTKKLRWRTVFIPDGYEFDPAQLYVANFAEQKAIGKFRLFFRRVNDNAKII